MKIKRPDTSLKQRGNGNPYAVLTEAELCLKEQSGNILELEMYQPYDPAAPLRYMSDMQTRTKPCSCI